MGNLIDLTRGDQHRIEVDELGAGDILPDSVLHVERDAPLAIALGPDTKGQPLAGGTVQFRCRGAMEVYQCILGCIEDRVGNKARYPIRIVEHQHSQGRVHITLAGPDQSKVAELAKRQAGFGRPAHAA